MAPLKHAKLSASGSAKWLSCSAAPALETMHGVDSSSEAAQEGTAAHALGEWCLVHGTNPLEYIGDVVMIQDGDGLVNKTLSDDEQKNLDKMVSEGIIENYFYVNDDMANAVTVYTDYVRALGVFEMHIEERVDFSDYVPGGFGTMDFGGEVEEQAAPSDHWLEGRKTKNVLYCVDYKHGKGLPVHAFENTQLMLYGLGALKTLDMTLLADIDELVLVVVQPRKDSVTEYRITRKDLLAWGDEVVRPRASIAWDLAEKTASAMASKGSEAVDPLAHVTPEYYNPTSKGCQWCKGKHVCKEKVRRGLEQIMDGFGDLTLEEQSDFSELDFSADKFRDLHAVSPDDLFAMWDNTRALLTWLNKLDDVIEEHMAKGTEVVGVKAVQKLKARAWKKGADGKVDNDGAVRVMRSAGLNKVDYAKEGIISPTEADKWLRKNKTGKDLEKRLKKLDLAITRELGEVKIVSASAAGESVYTFEQKELDGDDLL